MEIKLTKQRMKYGILIPIFLFAFAVIVLLNSYMHTGEFVKKGIDFEGGIQVFVHSTKSASIHDFESFIGKETGSRDVSVVTTTDPATRKQTAIIITVGGISDKEKLVSAIEDFMKIRLEPTQYSSTILGPALAETFWTQARLAFVFAFIFMTLVIGFAYRSIAPSLAIVIAVAYDLLIILGFMSFFNIDLTLGTYAALLMIIGYGVDTNVILTEKVVNSREGDVYERISKAMRTGLTMSSATIITLVALFVFGGSPVLKQIAAVLLIGIVSDIPNTWLFNGSLLIWFREKQFKLF